MILVDTSVWADHIARSDARLATYLAAKRVVLHPYVMGELALGNLPDRNDTLDALAGLPRATVAFDVEVMDFVERHTLFGTGIGYVDAHLLVSAMLGRKMTLWSRDRRLRSQAERLGIAHDPTAD
jgi:predicted nucleic acid-binding protein